MTLARNAKSIESERLVLRRIVESDLEFYCQLHADPDVVRYIGHGRPRTPDESRAWLHYTVSTYENLALGQLAVLRKSGGVLIGRCGLSDLAVEIGAVSGTVPRAWYERSQVPSDVERRYETELGYTLDRRHWGQGYAAEAACCVFEYARDDLKLPRVISAIHPDNTRSLRLAERFGLQRDGTLQILGQPKDQYVWPMRSGTD